MRDAEGAQSARGEGRARGRRTSGPVFRNRPAFRPQNALGEGELSTDFSCFDSAMRSIDKRCGTSACLISKILYLNANKSAARKKARAGTGWAESAGEVKPGARAGFPHSARCPACCRPFSFGRWGGRFHGLPGCGAARFWAGSRPVIHRFFLF